MSKLILPPDGKLRALTVREPFATMIAMGFKPIENRALSFPKSLPLPMTLAIHASTDDSTIGDDFTEVFSDFYMANQFNQTDWQPHKLGREYWYGGVIVGLVDVVACVCVSEFTDADFAKLDEDYPWLPGVQHPEAWRSDWANGPYCLILDNPRRLRTGVVCRGQQNYWRVPDDKMALLNADDVLLNPKDLPRAPVGGVAKMLGRIKAAV